MHLSSIYKGMSKWMLVYHTQPGSEEVELITYKIFKSKEKALKWFNRKYDPKDFVGPEAVKVEGFNHLKVEPDRAGYID